MNNGWNGAITDKTSRLPLLDVHESTDTCLIVLLQSWLLLSVLHNNMIWRLYRKNVITWTDELSVKTV